MQIKDLVIGTTYEITLVVKSATARETKAKKPYLALELYDGIDTIAGNYWDWSTGNIPEVNAILDVYAQVDTWQGVKQLNIKSMKTNKARHLAEFAPTSEHDLSDVYKNAYDLMSQVKDDTLRTIALAALEELRSYWLIVPGAKGVHHAYIGGTLVHSYSVAVIAKAMSQAVPEANEDLCVVGAFLHDIGKLYTYRLNGINIDITDEGNLYDHIFMGAEFIGNFAENLVDCDKYSNMKKVELLRHIILSHHGRLEFGSPVVPQCIEAHIVNFADNLDANIEQIRVAGRKAPTSTKWTERLYTVNNKPHLKPSYVEYIMLRGEEQ